MPDEKTKIRLDKWLWAARFYKTRSLATDAVQGGKVHLDHQRVKPAKEVRIGQQLTVRTGYTERTVIVTGLSARRGSATDAQALYEETAASLARRNEEAEQRRMTKVSGQRPGGERPTKKDRRLIHQFVRKPG